MNESNNFSFEQKKTKREQLKKKLKIIQIPFFLIRNSQSYYKRATRNDILKAKSKKSKNAKNLFNSKKYEKSKKNKNFPKFDIIERKRENNFCNKFDQEETVNDLHSNNYKKNYNAGDNRISQSHRFNFSVRDHFKAEDSMASYFRDPRSMGMLTLRKSEFSLNIDNIGNRTLRRFRYNDNMSTPILDKIPIAEMEKNIKEAQKSNRSNIDAESLNDNEDLCIICFANECNAVCMPCGHGGACIDCAQEIWQKSNGCFLCKTVIFCNLLEN